MESRGEMALLDKGHGHWLLVSPVSHQRGGLAKGSWTCCSLTLTFPAVLSSSLLAGPELCHTPFLRMQLLGSKGGHRECTLLAVQQHAATVLSCSSPPMSSTQETHGDVLQGPVFLSMSFSCDVGFVVEVWGNKKCWP